MAFHRLSKTSTGILGAAMKLATDLDADALLVLLDGAADWKRLKGIVEPLKIP